MWELALIVSAITGFLVGYGAHFWFCHVSESDASSREWWNKHQ